MVKSWLVLTGGLIAILFSSISQAAQTATAGCDSLVGPWEYVEPSTPGRAIIARTGTKYLLLYISVPAAAAPQQPTTSGAPSAGSGANGGAVEFACEGSGGKYRWTKMRWIYEVVPADAGTEDTLEMEAQGDNMKWWFLDADGKRGPMGAAKRLK